MTDKTKAAIKKTYADVLSVIEHMLPDDDDYDFQVFMQTDGLCISDMDGENYPVSMVIDLYEAKGERLTYDDLRKASI